MRICGVVVEGCLTAPHADPTISPWRDRSCGCGGIGRRAGFRCQWGQPRGGSSPLIRIGSTENRGFPDLGKRFLFFYFFIFTVDSPLFKSYIYYRSYENISRKAVVNHGEEAWNAGFPPDWPHRLAIFLRAFLDPRTPNKEESLIFGQNQLF